MSTYCLQGLKILRTDSKPLENEFFLVFIPVLPLTATIQYFTCFLISSMLHVYCCIITFLKIGIKHKITKQAKKLKNTKETTMESLILTILKLCQYEETYLCIKGQLLCFCTELNENCKQHLNLYENIFIQSLASIK